MHKMHKSLVIHPEDHTTDFLKPIYSTVKNKTVLTSDSNEESIKNQILESERVMMMGHGTPLGLLHVGKFESPTPFVVDDRYLSELYQKKNSIFIWCNAHQFVEKNNLQGLYTGMFISEVGEAIYCGLGKVSQEIIDESNSLFSSLVSAVIDQDVHKIHAHVCTNYKEITLKNPVAHYNYKRLYVR